MTLVEVLIAMVVMSIGITALVAGLGSGILAVQRGAKVSTAGALADQQMESYRRLSFAAIATDTTSTGAADATYTGDSALSGVSWQQITATCPGSPSVAVYYYCNPSRTTGQSNAATYRIDSYVKWTCGITGSSPVAPVSPATVPTCSTPAGEKASGPLKQVTIVVRDGGNVAKTLFRVTSTFQALTG
jgi:type II secretory pathway pseudopilin PulG